MWKESHSKDFPVARSNATNMPGMGRLSDDINASTRVEHGQLNRMIIERLPFALPPRTENPAILGHGLAWFAEVFFAFEDAWTLVEDQQLPAGCSGHDIQLRSWLKHLRPTGLMRSQRLRSDLAHIQRITNTQPLSACDSKLRSRLSHAVQRKPQILVAYAWVMYMATFSGGRWIRKQLLEAGDSFWANHWDKAARQGSRQILQDVHSPSGMSFLYFDGAEDGEDVKRAFKARLEHAEELLTTAERQDVVAEAQYIFQYCIKLIQDLDRSITHQAAQETMTNKWTMLLLCVLVYILWLLQNTLLERNSYRALAKYAQIFMGAAETSTLWFA